MGGDAFLTAGEAELFLVAHARKTVDRDFVHQVRRQTQHTPDRFYLGDRQPRTFSQVDIDIPDNYDDTSLYKEGYYLAANLFWYAKPNVHLGAEYLYGKRVDQNKESGQANRVQVMLQYNF